MQLLIRLSCCLGLGEWLLNDLTFDMWEVDLNHIMSLGRPYILKCLMAINDETRQTTSGTTGHTYNIMNFVMTYILQDGKRPDVSVACVIV